jgi:hypothetical protein
VAEPGEEHDAPPDGAVRTVCLSVCLCVSVRRLAPSSAYCRQAGELLFVSNVFEPCVRDAIVAVALPPAIRACHVCLLPDVPGGDFESVAGDDNASAYASDLGYAVLNLRALRTDPSPLVLALSPADSHQRVTISASRLLRVTPLAD